MKRLLALAGMAIVAFILPGCWNAKELNERAIVLAAGIDRADLPGQVELTVQILKPAAAVMPAGGGGSPGPEKAFWTVSSTGQTPFEAIRKAALQVGRKLFWGHVKAIIVGEALAREGITRYLDFFLRDHEARALCWLLIARGCKVKDLLQAEAGQEKLPASALDHMLKGYGVTSTIVPVNIHDFLGRLTTPGEAAVAPGLVLITREEDTKEGKGEKGEKKEIQYFRPSGTAVFRGDRLVGWLNDRETRGFLWVTSRVGSGILVVPAPDGRQAGLEIIRARSKIKARVEDWQVAIKVKIEEVGNLGDQTAAANLATPANFAVLEEKQAALIRSEVLAALSKAQRDYHADIFGFGQTLARHYPHVWRTLGDRWHEVYFPAVAVQVEIKARLDQTGLTGGPATAR